MTRVTRSAIPTDVTFSRLRKRAEAALAARQIGEAVSSLTQAAEVMPGNIETHLQLARLHFQLGEHNLGRAQVMKALDGRVESPRLALMLMRHLDGIGESGLVVDIARQLSPPMWDSAQSLSEVSRTLSMVGAHELADEFATAALTKNPADAAAVFQMAKMDVFFGRLESAEENVDRCLHIVPDSPAAHWLKSQLRLSGGEQRVDGLRQLLDRAKTADDACHLGYALHNELHQLKDYSAAWDALSRACAAKREIVRYRREDTEALFSALQQYSRADSTCHDGFVADDLRPIFIVGLHRSGTTLTERIISGHSAVAAGGETYDISAAIRRASGRHFRGELDAEALRNRGSFDYKRIGEEYLQGVRWRSGGKPIITDKLPSNFLTIGVILRAVPEARILCLQRDPMDVGLSNLRTLFSSACPYSYDQLDFADYAIRFDRLMAHWDDVFPGRILKVDYQELVDAPEASARRIASYCGLSFEPAMVKIEDRTDAVSTASSVMMREGIRRDRSKVWKRYETQLQPMSSMLEHGRHATRSTTTTQS